jgi:hypothetical protein
MKQLKIKTVDNSKIIKYFFPNWVSAFTLGRTIYVKNKYVGLNARQKNHENIHVVQYEKHGIVGFLFKYFIKEMFVSYKKKTFEIEAYANDDNLNYIQEKYGIEIVQ